MMTLFRAILFLIVVAVAIFFAVSNTATVDIVWSPLHESAAIPVFLLALGGLAIGFILGAFLVWFNNLSLVFDRRRKKKEIRKLEKKLEDKGEKTDHQTDADTILLTSENH